MVPTIDGAHAQIGVNALLLLLVSETSPVWDSLVPKKSSQH